MLSRALVFSVVFVNSKPVWGVPVQLTTFISYQTMLVEGL